MHPFLHYIIIGLTIVVTTIIILAMIIGPIYLYYKHLHKDVVHQSPGYVFFNDMDKVMTVLFITIVSSVILFIIGYVGEKLLDILQ